MPPKTMAANVKAGAKPKKGVMAVLHRWDESLISMLTYLGVCFLAPIMTFRAMKTVSSEDDIHWLMFWFTWGMFSVIEKFKFKFQLKEDRFHLYDHVKFFCVAFMGISHGSGVFFHVCFEPFFDWITVHLRVHPDIKGDIDLVMGLAGQVDQELLKLVTYTCVFLWAPIRSFIAAKTPEKEDDKQWLMFWIVWSILCGIEKIWVDILDAMPLWYEAKAVIVLYLIAGHGGTHIYESIVDPFMNLFDDEISEAELRLLNKNPAEYVNTFGARAYDRTRSDAKRKGLACSSMLLTLSLSG